MDPHGIGRHQRVEFAKPVGNGTAAKEFANITVDVVEDWSLTSLKEKLIKIGAKVVSHGRYVAFQMAEIAIPRQIFQEILRLIAELRPQPPPAAVRDGRATSDRICVVLDNLSTHSPGALYQAFPAEQARRVLRRLEFHYVPKLASWLNMVKIEIGVLAAQCLDRRIDSIEH